MASSLKKLTGVGGDVRKIARLLQAKAPAGHKLAYINDEEAALLKSRGGSGKPHSDTGIPSYQDSSDISSSVVDDSRDYGDVRSEPDVPYGDYSAPSASSFGYQAEGLQPVRQLTAGTGQGLGTSVTADSAIETPNIVIPPSPKYALDTTRRGAEALLPTGAPAAKEGMSDETMKRLGLAGITGLLGSRQAGKAAAAGRAGSAQMQNIAAPYQQAGAQIQAQSQRGELTPQAQQSLQAVQAQAAQGAERRGGVGAQQVQAQVEAFRQQLLQQQYDYGLKLSGIGDNIALGAIKTGLQADQYVNQLTNQYYGNIARVAFGSAPQVPGAIATAGGNQ
jgi:hypothetical protein